MVNALNPKKKKKIKIIKRIHPISIQNTGKTEIQILLLTRKIDQLSFHLELHPEDYGSTCSLRKLIGQRKRLLKYLCTHNFMNYSYLLECIKTIER